jgi:osmotically-inducible protein OsmY
MGAFRSRFWIALAALAVAAAAAQAPRGDREVEAAIRARLAQSKIAADRFTVRVQGGMATLEGRTAVSQHKGVATRLAKSAGAQSVVNNIQTGDAARQRTGVKPALAAEPPRGDRELETAIRTRLAQSKIAADKFTVRVQGGVATIEGRTDVMQHKGAATRVAKSAGALRVVNKVQISDAARQKASANLAQGRRRAQIRRGEARSERPGPRP